MGAVMKETPEHKGRHSGSMITRVAVMETRWEDVIPNLATKTDLAELRVDLKGDYARLESKTSNDIAELRADIHKMDATFSRWMLATVIALIVGFGGMFFALQRSIDDTLTRIERIYATHPALIAAPIAPVTAAPPPAQSQD